VKTFPKDQEERYLIQFLRDLYNYVGPNQTLEVFLLYSFEKPISKIAFFDKDRVYDSQEYTLKEMKERLENLEKKPFQVYNPQAKTLDTLAGFKVEDEGVTIEALLKPFTHLMRYSGLSQLEIRLKSESPEHKNKIEEYCSLFERVGYKSNDE